MQIRIIKEKQFEPVFIKYPTHNPDFFNIQQPASNIAIPHQQRLQVFMHKQVYEFIWKHALTDTGNELGGALLGYFAHYNQQQFLLITDVLNQPPAYFASPLMIKFTTNFYTDLENYLHQVNSIYPHIIRLGLYHTHPNYGIFMSKTDIAHFKQTYKDKHFIVLIVDPLQQKDGVFYWEKEQLQEPEQAISPAVAYFTYETHNPAYAPHVAVSDNSLITACNSILVNRQGVDNTSDQQGMSGIIKTTEAEASGSKNEKIKLTINSDNLSKHPKTHRIPDTDAKTRLVSEPVSMVCPLYDIRYRCSVLQLKQYQKSLKNYKQHTYPYQIFVSDHVRQQLSEQEITGNGFAGVLHGTLGYDTLKEIYFLYVTKLSQLNVPDTGKPLPLSGLLPQLVAETQKLHTDVVGWLVIDNNLHMLPYQYYEAHQSMFTQNHCIGLLLKPPKNSAPDFENMTLVAYDHQQQTPYDFYRYFFFYKAVFQTVG